MRYFYLIFSLLVLASCKSDSNETAEKEEVLLYLSIRNSNYDIYKNDLNGNETRLTTNPGYDYSPMWNESLNKLIYYSYVEDSFLIAAKDLDGQTVSLNTYGQIEFNLSPNGQYLINQVQVGDTSVLVLSNLDGTDLDTIANAGSYNGRAKWSWESDQVAFISDQDGNNEVYVYSLETKEKRRLTINDTFEKYITWEPGGKRLAYTTQYYEDDKPDRNDVFVFDLDSMQAQQITSNEFNDSEIAWSPLSGKIAFHSKRDSVDHIYLMNSDGSNVQKISMANAYHGEPNWALKPIK